MRQILSLYDKGRRFSPKFTIGPVSSHATSILKQLRRRRHDSTTDFYQLLHFSYHHLVGDAEAEYMLYFGFVEIFIRVRCPGFARFQAASYSWSRRHVKDHPSPPNSSMSVRPSADALNSGSCLASEQSRTSV